VINVFEKKNHDYLAMTLFKNEKKPGKIKG
jgi:hypothetical protein